MENNGYDGGQNSHNVNNKNNNSFSSSSIWDQLIGGHVSHSRLPDPHLTCLKLGKRQYFEDSFNITPIGERHVALTVAGGGFSSYEKKSNYYNTSAGGIVPRCQVEGCHVSLVTSKEYHRRHKVCEMHSKAVVVLVSGLQQRFCQQCSRFHGVCEFDKSKRSCRWRLAGHNQRRRKNNYNIVFKNSSQDNKSMNGRIPYPSSSSTQASGHDRSLLSSKFETWYSSSDISARSRAALHELIEESRATILARQLFLDVNSEELGQEINVKSRRELKAQIKRLKHDVAKINEDHKSIEEEQREMQKKVDEIKEDCKFINSEAEEIAQLCERTQRRLDLIFMILEARKNNDFVKANILARSLGMLLVIQK